MYHAEAQAEPDTTAQSGAAPAAMPPDAAGFADLTLQAPDAATLRADAQAARAGDGAAITRLAAALCHAAYRAPEKIAAIYDAASAGWTGADVRATPIEGGDQPGAPLTGAFWQDFWQLAQDSTQGISAGEITVRTAKLAAHLAPGFEARTAAGCSAYPGVVEAARGGFPARITKAQLEAAPAGSLGHDFYRQIIDNNFDIEVLDRDTLGLTTLMPPLDYLNARMLQTHDLWHITAGYHTTKLHEVGLSAFQMAQFGHQYSAMFLALVVTTSAYLAPAGVPVLLEIIFTGWVHGRQTPPMMLIPWESAWAEPTATLRTRYGISEYVSPYPPNLAEMLDAAA